MASGSPRLMVLKGARQGTTVEISTERPVTIGSHRQSDLHLRDAAVSWDHARLWLERGEVLIEDLGSANGTLLNGQRVSRGRVLPGDTLTVGNTELTYMADEAASPALPGAAWRASARRRRGIPGGNDRRFR